MGDTIKLNPFNEYILKDQLLIHITRETNEGVLRP